MGRHVDAAETEPVGLPPWPTIALPVRRRRLFSRRVAPRRAVRRHRRRVDGDLVLCGFVLFALAAVCAVLSLVTPEMPRVAAWTWFGGGVTALALSFARPAHGAGGCADVSSIRGDSVDASSSIDVRTA